MTTISTLWAGTPQKKWSSHHGQQKSLKCSTWMQSQKRQNDFCSFPRQTIQCHGHQVYAPTSNAEEAEVEQARPFRTNTQKRCSFHYRELECKSRKSRNTWVTGEFGLGIWNEVVQRLIEFCQENALVIANTPFQQHKR